MSASVRFTEPINLPAPPVIVGAGKVQFNRQAAAGVSFLKPVDGPYAVVVTGDGYNGGALAHASTVFFVKDCTPHGFTIFSGDNNCRQLVSYIAVSL